MTTGRPDRHTQFEWIALAAGLLPFAVVHLCYAISVSAGLVPACIPYLEGCTSISAAGRHGVAWIVFKLGMIPAAGLLAGYWVLTRRWLLALGSPDTAASRAMVWLGVIAAAFLVLYAVFLGSKGDFYNLMRRYGVTVFFSFSALAQMVQLRELKLLAARGARTPPRWILRGQLTVVSVLLATGLVSIPANDLAPDKDRAENVIEWIFAALMSSYYVLSWVAWRATRVSPLR
jgi:hypothetical protein